MTTATKELKTEATKVTGSWLFWTLLGGSILFHDAPIIGTILAPLNLFSTMVHEMSHALICLMTGGYVSGMTIVSDGSGHGGLTFCRQGNQLLISPAGYLGTALVGSTLIALSRFPKISKGILLLIGAALSFATIFLVGLNVLNTGWQGVLSFFGGAAMSIFLLWAGLKWKAARANVLLLFLATQTALNSLSSLVDLAKVSLGMIPFASFSDASSMQAMTMIPAGVWAVLWSLISLVLVGGSFWLTYGPKKARVTK